MKTRLIIISAILSLTILSCKNDDQKEEKKEEVVKQNVKENFSFEMNVVSLNKDDFSMFYTEDGTINFKGEQAVWFGVNPKSESQKVVFDLKEEILPSNIRVDFGLVQDKGDVTIENFKMSYYGKTFEAKGSDFLRYFIPNETVKTDVDQTKGTIRIQKLPNKPFTPFFYPQQALLDEIKKITK